MDKYEVVHMDSNKKFYIENDEVSKLISDMVNNYVDDCYNELDQYRKLHSIIPIFDEYGLDEAYFIFNYDDPVYDVTFTTEESLFIKKLTKHCLDIVLKSNKVIIDDTWYKVKDIITDISYSSPEVRIECETITFKDKD